MYEAKAICQLPKPLKNHGVYWLFRSGVQLTSTPIEQKTYIITQRVLCGQPQRESDFDYYSARFAQQHYQFSRLEDAA